MSEDMKRLLADKEELRSICGVLNHAGKDGTLVYHALLELATLMDITPTQKRPQRPEDRGLAQRMEDHNAVRRAGGSPRAAIRAYCRGNRWLEENAKAVGNWYD